VCCEQLEAEAEGDREEGTIPGLPQGAGGVNVDCAWHFSDTQQKINGTTTNSLGIAQVLIQDVTLKKLPSLL
jgi:hypothetical protein